MSPWFSCAPTAWLGRYSVILSLWQTLVFPVDVDEVDTVSKESGNNFAQVTTVVSSSISEPVFAASIIAPKFDEPLCRNTRFSTSLTSPGLPSDFSIIVLKPIANSPASWLQLTLKLICESGRYVWKSVTDLNSIFVIVSKVFCSSDSANAVLLAVIPVNIIIEKIMLRSFELCIAILEVFFNKKNIAG